MMRTLFILGLIHINCDGNKLYLGKIVSLSPIKCSGKFSVGDKSKDAVFLCRSGRLEVVQNNEESNEITIYDVIPVGMDYDPFQNEGFYLYLHLSCLRRIF